MRGNAVTAQPSCPSTWAMSSNAASPGESALRFHSFLGQDKAPPCHCFGTIHSAPISRPTLMSAGLLAGLSALAATSTVYLLTSGLKGFIMVLFAILGGLKGASKISRYRISKGLHRKPLQLKVGRRVPTLRLGDERRLEDHHTPHSRSLPVLTSDSCTPCKYLEAALRRWSVVVGQTLPIFWLRGEFEPATSQSEPWHAVSHTDLAKFLCPTPGGILVDGKGTLISEPVAGSEMLEALIRATLSSRSDLPS